MRELTREQAAAFLDALLGWEDVAEQQAKPKSPHARTHLKAVLGYGNLPSSDYIRQMAYGHGKSIWDREKASFLQLADYLSAVADVIRREVQGDE